jgi:hypothetical protein
MDNKLYSKLSAITVEESRILSGNPAINKKLYMSGMDSIVDSAKLLSEGRIITCRPHTRFIHFPAHRHNYIEMVYMYSGETHHVVDGNHIFLKQGELLFLSEKASHEIYPAGVNDIAVNFIILPEFFTRPLDMIGDDPSPLHDFLVKGLLGNEIAPSYLHFKASDILAVQNLAENLIWAIETDKSSMRAVNNITMGELFLSLLGYCTFQDIKSGNKDQELMIAVLNYIDESNLTRSWGYTATHGTKLTTISGAYNSLTDAVQNAYYETRFDVVKNSDGTFALRASSNDKSDILVEVKTAFIRAECTRTIKVGGEDKEIASGKFYAVPANIQMGSSSYKTTKAGQVYTVKRLGGSIKYEIPFMNCDANYAHNKLIHVGNGKVTYSIETWPSTGVAEIDPETGLVHRLGTTGRAMITATVESTDQYNY